MTKTNRLATRINDAPVWVVALSLSLGLAALFSFTAEWNDPDVNVDAVAAALPAWSLAQRGTIELTGVGPANPWIEAGANGVRSNRPPGVYLTAIPAYLLLGTDEQFSTDPSTLTAVLLTSAAMGVAYMALTTLLPGVAALVATLVVALGTATWPISSMQLWAHSPGQLAAAFAILGLATDRMMLTGAAFAAGILIRPPIAVFPAFTGLGSLLDKSRFGRRAFLIIGITAALSLIALLFYNYAIFGAADVSGGYSSAFTERLITMGWDEYLPNLAAMFVGPMNGLFFWSPVMLVATAGIFEEHSAAPRWSKVVALAGLAYLFLHARLNRASGGLPFNYRYPLEPIVVALPLLAVAAYRWTERGGWRRTAVISSAILSIILQALYTFTLSCMPHTASEVICSLGL